MRICSHQIILVYTNSLFRKFLAPKMITWNSAWNKYFASAGHCVWQSALRAGQLQFVTVFCIWYTIEIWNPAGHCDRQKTNRVGHIWNRVGEWLTDDRWLFHALNHNPLFSFDFNHEAMTQKWLHVSELLGGGPERDFIWGAGRWRMPYLYSMNT